METSTNEVPYMMVHTTNINSTMKILEVSIVVSPIKC